jgi:hypothetical protein
VFDTIQGLLVFGLWGVMLVVKAFAFIDCLRRPQQAFPAIGRQNKVLWLALTGASAVTGLLLNYVSPFGIVGLAGIVVSLIYLFDVRPKILEITGRR